MAIAFDAESNSAVAADPTWTHTPSGTPAGAVVLVIQNGGVEETVTADWGGTAMTARTPIDGSGQAEPAWIYPFVLLSSVPTGAQTVTVNASGATNKLAFGYTVTAGAVVEVDDEDSFTSSSQDDPFVDLTATTTVLVMSALFSGLGNSANLTAGTGFTKTFGGSLTGSSGNGMRSTSPHSSGTVTVQWVSTAADDALLYAIALRESSGGSPITVNLGIAEETDIGLSTVMLVPMSLLLGIASETDEGLPLSVVSQEISLNLGIASETDEGLALSIVSAPITISLGIPEELDEGLTLTLDTGSGTITIPLGIAGETDEGLPLAIINPMTLVLGIGEETDTALRATVEVEGAVVVGPRRVVLHLRFGPYMG